MQSPSSTRYAPHGDGYVAYRVCGTGPPDIVLVLDWFGHVEEMWAPASPLLPVLERLATFGRLVTFDRRGVGMSDGVPVGQLPTLESWMDDIRAVMDDCRIDQAAVVAKGSGGAMGLLFAASYPARVVSLVLINTYARLSRADDYPVGVVRCRPGAHAARTAIRRPAPPACCRGATSTTSRSPGGTATSATRRPPASPGPCARCCCTVDVRSVLPSVRAPTLVLHRRDDRYIELAHGQYLAEHIDGAELVELPGASDLLFAGDPDEVARRDRRVPHRRPPVGAAEPGAVDGAVHRHRRLDQPGWRTSATRRGAPSSTGTT